MHEEAIQNLKDEITRYEQILKTVQVLSFEHTMAGNNIAIAKKKLAELEEEAKPEPIPEVEETDEIVEV